MPLTRQTGMTRNVGRRISKLEFLFWLAQVGWALKWIEIRFLVKRDRESEITVSRLLHAGLKSFSVSLNVSCDSSNA
ncbi:isopropylmalate isomerase small subunit [Stappia aggregata IAM 12614]|uniref:Isopropylmalate isomerase small subunit n=1 Tax=Roseibium aggregatum (strain ATCC 25650 / DSM 13394 / JCM 20685 / NBRC 16684 / NCIMB 2208 / IAM 12614 / B1) TaxID=384765 RepID=A0NWT2_ROSAI|nr:isopropylmalate isomerase small subunit [Stappia aggregata IAM 12614] [Roseibium aggregatum IAM 12614]